MSKIVWYAITRVPGNPGGRLRAAFHEPWTARPRIARGREILAQAQIVRSNSASSSDRKARRDKVACCYAAPASCNLRASRIDEGVR